MKSAVLLENIKKTYRGLGGRKSAIENISLDVRKGGIFGLLGPNGAGKTTTLKVMLGLVFPDSGTGSLLGLPLGDREAHARLGFLPEQPYFYGFLTAEKALDLYGKFFGLERAERTARTARLLDLVGLREGSHLTLDKYSKGMLQRFGIAQALLNDPELLVLDEPSSGLDPVGQKEVRDILLTLRSEGKTIFLSSHQLSEVENICDDVSIISAGRSVSEGSLIDLLAVSGITRISLGKSTEEARERLAETAKRVSVEDDVTVLEVEEGNVYRAIDEARDLGLELLGVAPYRRSLEDLFMEAIRENQ